MTMTETEYFVKGRSSEALIHGVKAGYDDPELLLSQLDYCQNLLSKARDQSQIDALTAQIITLTKALSELTQ
jgi:hypothetical protein